MSSLMPEFLEKILLSSGEASTIHKLGEYRGKQALYEHQSPEALRMLKQVAIVESNESSNRLEGITAPAERIKAIVLKAATPKNRSEQEIAGYRDALDLIHESAKYMPFSTNVLLQLHSLVYRYLPGVGGRWKMTDNEIIERNADGTVKRVRFKPVSAVQTPFRIETLSKQYQQAIEAQDKEPLIVIPLTILDFLFQPSLSG